MFLLVLTRKKVLKVICASSLKPIFDLRKKESVIANTAFQSYKNVLLILVDAVLKICCKVSWSISVKKKVWLNVKVMLISNNS